MSLLGRRSLIVGGAATSAAVALGCSTAASPSSPRIAAPALGTRGVNLVVRGQPSMDGAGVSLVRHLGQQALSMVDPFVLLDELHSDDPHAYIAGFPDHPHRGFETVSVMLEGRMRHRDSRGNQGLIQGGGVQWMTAGRGIVHSEMPEQERGTLWGFQLWVNLPREEKWRAQEYQDIQPERIAEVALDDGGLARVIAGEALGVRGPVAARTTRPLLVSLRLAPREDVELRVGQDAAALVLVAEGGVRIGREREHVDEGTLAVLEPTGRLVRLRAGSRGATALVVSGEPLREPVARRGPFVMNTESELDQAFADYRAGRLG